MKIQILIFEDKPDDAKALVEAIDARLVKGDGATIVWFSDGFDPSFDHEGKLAEIYPAKTKQDYAPMTVDLSQGISIPRTTDDDIDWKKGKVTWWQSEFHAAILDIFMEGTDEPVGYHFAQWLANAEFQGPVVVVSRRDRVVRRFDLVGAEDVRKTDTLKDGELPWTHMVAKCILDGALTVCQAEDKSKGRSFRVNYKGRDPERFLADFYDLSDSTREPLDWRYMYFGDDEDLSRRLGALFCMKPYTFRRSDTRKNIAQITKILEAADVEAGRKPNVMFIDCGTESGQLTGDLVRLVASAVERVSFDLIYVFLTDKDRLEDNLSRELLVKTNGGLAPRTQLNGYLGLWAGKSIEGLRASYTRFGEVADAFHGKMSGLKDEAEWSEALLEAGTHVLRELLFPLLLARSQARLFGLTEFPSLAAWAGPVAGKVLNRHSAAVVRTIVEKLEMAGRITEKQRRLINKEARIPKTKGLPTSKRKSRVISQ